jgi:para-aminobenzoate synthetase component I
LKATNTSCNFTITDFNEVKKKVLNWANRFSTFCFLDNHQYNMRPHTVECMLAVGSKRIFTTNAGDALNGLQHFIDQKPSWLFGHLGYDLKNEIEGFTSSHPDHIGFTDICFFEPETIIRLSPGNMTIEGAPDPDAVFKEIGQQQEPVPLLASPAIQIQQRLSRTAYLQTIEQLRAHILRGDCYEINFCQEFFAENTSIDPLQVYQSLSMVSPNPFSALYKLHDKFLICASPERYLKKQGTQMLSQPIKGTSTRYLTDQQKDQLSRDELFHSEKDRSENVMVVDLVRNDLSKVCKEGTVKVDELYGVYSFPQVHQMISTVSGEVKEGVSFSEMVSSTFPMGSMTGAPKRRVMELIERYEKTKRGIFSGAVGYINPDGDFDFNVVIRSIIYNSSNKYLSYQVGSGITFYSEPEKEYEECLLKAEAIISVLSVSRRDTSSVEPS